MTTNAEHGLNFDGGSRLFIHVCIWIHEPNL